jgi:hypothetical protein
MGKTWVRADDNQHQFGHLANAGMIEADRNVYGRIYRSTAGTGIPFMDVENPTAAQTVDQQMEVQFYPNPFISTINMKLNSPIEQIQIYNLAGILIQTIFSEQKPNQTVEFGADLKRGMYLVKVVGSNSAKSYKIVKN